MPLEICRYNPGQPEIQQWKKIHTVYPGEEVQIPHMTSSGKFEFIRVWVKEDDSMSTVHTIFPEEIIIRSKESGLPSQIRFNPELSENFPHVIRKGEYLDVFSRMLIVRPEGNMAAEITRGRLYHK